MARVKRTPVRKVARTTHLAIRTSRFGTSRRTIKRKLGVVKRRFGTAKRGRRNFRFNYHIGRDVVKEDVMAMGALPRGMRPKTSTNIYQVAPIGAQISVQSGTQSYQCYYSASKTQLTAALTTTGMAPSSTGLTQNTAKIHYYKYTQNWMFTNNTSATCMIKLYHYTCKDDTVTPLPNFWVTGMEDAQGNVTDNTGIWGVEPRLSPAIYPIWGKPVIKEYTLAPGGTLNHMWVNRLNKNISNEKLGDSDLYMRGITQAMLIVVRGTAGTDGVNAALVNTTPVKLDMLYTQTCSFTYLADNDNNLKVVAGSGTGANGNNVTVVNVTGAATQNITAAGF